MDESSSPAKRKRKQTHPLLKDAVKSNVTSVVDERSEEVSGLFERKDLWLIQLPKDVSGGGGFSLEHAKNSNVGVIRPSEFSPPNVCSGQWVRVSRRY